jgi:pyridinium-3,5-bisthiocarboxylic acid mononucleotide nickel chelatase
MKRYLRLDSVGGASGDMILSALVSIGADLEAIEKTLNSFFPEKLTFKCETASASGLTGICLKVHCPASGVLDPASCVLSPESNTWPDAHHAHEHEHRGLKEITTLLAGSPLSEATRSLALRVFRALGEAEAKIHNTSLEKIHFHEVGAWDSVADIVGSCLALEQLGICGVSCGPLPVGIGTITCSHGQMPNPAPATQELLQGMRVVQTDEPFELVTPTGAALLRVWTQTLERVPEETVLEKSGFGFGTRALKQRPNVLRATVMRDEKGVRVSAFAMPTADRQGSGLASGGEEKLLVLEANLDDCNPEWIASLVPVLLEQGALDVWQTPILMKKGRAGVLLSVLAPETLADALRETIFRGTTTFGIRYYPVRREVLERRFEQVATPYGEVPVKVGLYKGEAITRSPEHDACEALAKAHGVTVKQVWPK